MDQIEGMRKDMDMALEREKILIDEKRKLEGMVKRRDKTIEDLKLEVAHLEGDKNVAGRNISVLVKHINDQALEIRSLEAEIRGLRNKSSN